MLSWRIHRALMKAKLEPFLGFLHALKHERASLVCDFAELYRFLVEDFLIQNCQGFNMKDFSFKAELVHGKMGKRQYLNNTKTSQVMKRLDLFFEEKVEVPRIYLGKQQTLETLINEEALLLAMFMRGKKNTWMPRILPLLEPL